MSSECKIAVLSDLHLREPSNDKRYPLFVKTLEQLAKNPQINEIWLMGDIFDIMIGSFKSWKLIHKDFFRCIEAIKARGAKIVWVQGNHDFQLDKMMLDLGIEWIPQSRPIVRAGITFHLEHGDLVDSSDKLHYLWRAFLTSKALRFFLSIVPEWFAFKVLYPLTLLMSSTSRAVSRNPAKNEHYRKLFRDYAKSRADGATTHWVLLGHSHVADIMPLPNGYYLNAGSWFETPQIAIIALNSSPAAATCNLFSVESWLGENIST